MYPRVLLNSDGLAHKLRELLEICKDNRKGKINYWMSLNSWLDSRLHFVSIYISALLLTVEFFNVEGHVRVE